MSVATLRNGIAHIQYASNLVLAHTPIKQIPHILKPSAPILALLGDIGQPFCLHSREFFKWAEDNYSLIFWIPGSLEYSSLQSSCISWNERADQYYQSLQLWGLSRTSFCQKLEYRIPWSPFTLLCSSYKIPYHSTRQIYKYDYKGLYKIATYNDYERFNQSESDWLTKTTGRISGPIIACSYMPVPYGLKVQANLFGITHVPNYPRTFSGETSPWSTINMAGHTGFRKDAYVSFVERFIPN
jgi:hypothetical protein